ncbi:MAG: hypothetical protein WC716_14195 [Chitinophagaceae bacterium]
MKTIYNLIVLLCLNLNSIAQLPKAFEYYKIVNKAELAICDSSFINAHKLYADAFKINSNKAFSIDLLNAFKVSMDLKLYGDASWCLTKLLGRGLKSNKIKELFGLYKNEDSVFIRELLAKSNNDTFKFNHPLNLAITEMMVSDQGARKYFGELHNGNYMVDSTYKVDLSNATKLKVLFNKYRGIPNEEVLGSHFGNPPYSILISHHKAAFIGGYPFQYFDTMLLEAVFNYDLKPDFIAQYFNNGNFSYLIPWTKNDYVQTPLSVFIAKFKNTICIANTSKDREQAMNSNRAKLGLCTLAELRKKIIFCKQTQSKYYFETGFIAQFDCDNEEALEQWKKAYSF